MNIWEVIAAFIYDQQYVMRRLQSVYGWGPNIKAFDWCHNYELQKAAHDANPIAKTFYMHGFGLEFKDEIVNIDFDFCISGREGGFDAWRLYLYCKEHPNLNSVLKEHLEFIHALDALYDAGTLERVESLYFLPSETKLKTLAQPISPRVERNIADGST